ncbi:Secretory immunoglobulin A-binding protein EsiB, partial [termite gut metagenome]
QGEEEGQYNLGMCYDNGAGTPVDHKLAFEWFKKSSDQGYSLAQHNLGIFYEEGIATIVGEDDSKTILPFLASTFPCAADFLNHSKASL